MTEIRQKYVLDESTGEYVPYYPKTHVQAVEGLQDVIDEALEGAGGGEESKDAGNIAFDINAEYPEGSAGKEMQQLAEGLTGAKTAAQTAASGVNSIKNRFESLTLEDTTGSDAAKESVVISLNTEYNGETENIGSVTLDGATKEKAGLMSAADKGKLENADQKVGELSLLTDSIQQEQNAIKQGLQEASSEEALNARMVIVEDKTSSYDIAPVRTIIQGASLPRVINVGNKVGAVVSSIEPVNASGFNATYIEVSEGEEYTFTDCIDYQNVYPLFALMALKDGQYTQIARSANYVSPYTLTIPAKPADAEKMFLCINLRNYVGKVETGKALSIILKEKEERIENNINLLALKNANKTLSLENEKGEEISSVQFDAVVDADINSELKEIEFSELGYNVNVIAARSQGQTLDNLDVVASTNNSIRCAVVKLEGGETITFNGDGGSSSPYCLFFKKDGEQYINIGGYLSVGLENKKNQHTIVRDAILQAPDEPCYAVLHDVSGDSTLKSYIGTPYSVKAEKKIEAVEKITTDYELGDEYVDGKDGFIKNTTLSTYLGQIVERNSGTFCALPVKKGDKVYVRSIKTASLPAVTNCVLLGYADNLTAGTIIKNVVPLTNRNYTTDILNKYILVDCIEDGYLVSTSSGIDFQFYKAKKISLLEKNIDGYAEDVVLRYNTPANKILQSNVLYRKSADGDNWLGNLNILHFSDVHKDEEAVRRIVKLGNAWKNQLDCIVNSGDTVSLAYTEGLEWYDNILNNAELPVLTSVGNHDAMSVGTFIGSMNSADKNAIYNMIVAKTKERVSNIVQPSLPQGKLYYYYDVEKDYYHVSTFKGHSVVRIIVLADMQVTDGAKDGIYDAEQIAWIESVLADALQKNIPVMCVNHTIGNVGSFTPLDSRWMSYWAYAGAQPMSEEPVQKVKNFIDAGGQFLMWVGGHVHRDMVGTMTADSRQFVFLSASAASINSVDGNQAYKVDCFNAISISTYEKQPFIRIWRLGYGINEGLQEHHLLCYDYVNHRIVSES